MHELTYSGSPYSTLRLAKALRESGYEVTVWSSKNGEFKREYECNNIHIEVVPFKLLRDREVIKNFKRFDLLIANSILTGKAVEAIGNFIPTVWYIREAQNIPEFFENDYKRGYLLKGNSSIWVVSDYAKEYVDEFFNTNAYVVHNCVDDVYGTYKNLSERNQRIKIIMIGTIESRKNFLLYVKAYHQLKAEEQNRLEIHIVGREIEAEKLYCRRVIEEAERSENIVFHGEIQDRNKLMDLISGMNVVAVVSKDESCSLTALEGAMMGKPLLLSENVGAKYLLTYSNGWIVKTDSEEALTRVFSEIIQLGNERLHEMGQGSRKAYLETSTFDIYKANVKKAVIYHGFSNKINYYLKNFIKRRVWYVDETEAYYQYPNWGYEDEQHHVYSFDIFDTIITRDVAKPEGIFLLMQEKLQNSAEYIEIPQYIRDNFVQLRLGAEGLARQSFCINGIEDKTLEEIYQALCMTGKINDTIADRLMQLEMMTEYEHSIGISCTIESIKQLLTNGKRVILISDMYLSAEMIRKLLVKHNDIFEKIPIYVSSECRKMKGSTHLFKYVQNIEKVSFKNWTHTGDNENADIKAPATLGIRTERCNRAELMQYEKEALEEMPLNLNVQLLIGLSKKFRVTDIEQLSEYEILGTSIGGNMVLPYIYWMIINMRKMGLKKIYFFKENMLIKRAADIIISALEYDIQTDVIEGTERIWGYLITCQFASKKQLSLQLEELINREIVSVEEIFDILEVSKKEMNRFIPSSIREHLNQFPDYLDNAFRWMIINEKGQQFLFDKWIKKIRMLVCGKTEKAAISYMECGFINKPAVSGEMRNGRYRFFVFSKDITDTVEFSDIKYFMPIRKKDLFNAWSFYWYGINSKKLSETQKRMIMEYEKGVIKFVEGFANHIYLCKRVINTELLKVYIRHTVGNCTKSVRQFVDIYKSLTNQTLYGEERNAAVTYGLNNSLITRSVASKEGVFLLMKKRILEKELLNEYETENFFKIRREAENVYANMWRISLDEIYNNISEFGEFPIDIINGIKEIELNIESECYNGISRNIVDIVMNYMRGNKVIIICNSYFSTKFIRELLIKESPMFKDISIYTTCEYPKIESPEDFFQYIHDVEQIDYRNWKHIGNELTFDVNRPQKLGIQVERTELTKLMPYENAALKEFENNIVVQNAIGLSKMLRVNKQLAKHEILGCFGGAMLYSYVQWVIDDALDRGFEKLLFVARDGYVLKIIADTIIYVQNLKIETEYAYGSRKAWRMPSYTADEDLSIFFKMAHISQLGTMQELSKIFDISYSEFENYIPENYYGADYALNTSDYKILREYLETRLDFKMYLEKQAHEKKELVLGYIKQIMDNKKCAFVELSGSGATQNCLAKMVKPLDIGFVSSYFLNLDSMNMEENSEFINYLPNNSSKIYIIENLCRAVQGQTLGYKMVDNKYVPVLEISREGDALIKHGYLSYLKGVMYYANAFSQLNCLTVLEKERPVIFQKYLRHLVFNPCSELLNFIADMPFEATGNKNELHFFAPRLTEEQIEQIFFDRGSESVDKYYCGSCLDYSIKRMSQEERARIEYYRKLIPTKEGQKIRMQRRIKEKGYFYTIKFAYRRFLRSIFLRFGIIHYKN